MYSLLFLLFLHFVADFLLQSRKMGKTKSEDLVMLLTHIFIIYGVITAGSLLILPWGSALLLGTINAIIHGVIDANIWNLYKKSVHWRYPLVSLSFKYWEDPYFYHTIGLDQFLHGATLVLLYGMLA